jgi:IclR family acetate operon transcriptional repressor
MSDPYIVKPVFKALRVLECLGEAQQELSLSQIARRVQLPKTSVFRYLHTLQQFGFVSHDAESDHYRIGLRMWELGQLTDERVRIREIALPFMRELGSRYKETINLGVLDHNDIVYMEMVESPYSLRTQAEVGSRNPVYSTALGKAILAFIPGEQWRNHLPPSLTPRTPQTLTSVDALEANLQEVRRLGFAVDHGENEAGASCVGAPIFNRNREVIAAISISAPTSRLNGALEDEAAADVNQTALDISIRLGYRP